MDSPAPCPTSLLLAKWEEAFAALDADIVSNHLVALSTVGLGPRVAELRQRMMRSASILTPLRPAKHQHRPDLFSGVPLKPACSVKSAATTIITTTTPPTATYAATAAKIPSNNKRMRSNQPRREFAAEELAKCVRPSSANAPQRMHPNWRVVHLKGFAPPKSTPVLALIALLAQYGLPVQTRTIWNISYMGFGMTEVVIEAGHFDAFTAAANAAGLEVSTDLNARLPCFRESGETAYARFLARINVRIDRLETIPPSTYFDDLFAFLKAYHRDGDSNCPTFAPAARTPTQLNTAFASVSNSLPSMGEGY